MMGVIEIKDLPKDSLVVGYYWLSDEPAPEVIEYEPFGNVPFQRLPFIIEANFWSEKDRRSYNISFRDGAYYVYFVDVPDPLPVQFKRVDYLAKGMKDIDKIRTVEIWQETEIEGGFHILKHVNNAFIGFKNKD